jgi:hypothetical protein
MIQGRKRINLTTDSILDKISEYDIYKFYMPHQNWKINVVTYSPFRNEKNPSFIIGYHGGALRFCDFGDSSKKGGCFDFIMMLFNISLREALLMIDRDFDLGIVTGSSTKNYERIISDYAQPTATSKREFFIQVKTRKFTNEELAYWNGYYQDIDDLRANNVYSIDTLYLNKKKFPIENLEKRTMNLIGSGLVDIVKHTYLVNPAETFEEVIERYKDFEIEFFRGDDWADFPGIEAIKEAGIKITYLPYTREISSTILRDQL